MTRNPTEFTTTNPLPSNLLTNSISYLQFYLTFILAALGIIVPIVTINTIIDPYGIFMSPITPGFNNMKTRQRQNSRLFKPIHASQAQYDTLLIGTSRVEQGWQADSPGLGAERQAYNLAMGAQNTYETLAYTQHAITTNPKIKTILVGIDFWTFLTVDNGGNIGRGFESYRLNYTGLHPWDGLRFGLSTHSFWRSLEVVSASAQYPDKQVYTTRGTRNFSWPPPQPQKWPGNWFLVAHRAIPQPHGVVSSYFHYLEELVAICRERDIDLQLIITPAHTLSLRALEQFSDLDVYDAWKRRLVTIAPLWDFSDVNSVTTESVGPEMQHYDDIWHYSTTVGDWMMARVLGVELPNSPADFGKRVDLKTIDKHLIETRSRYQQWKREHLPDLKQLEQHWKRTPIPTSSATPD